ncbi:MAG: hypothetical protein PHC28_09225 [Flavobacterium sp.]|uniref:hypothetical protein n=1 Tax=Flavobacterium sp. TaxID=239 RepID=UPI002617D77E|nr:hypothetical protein [Flavobacterium sp.]MDD5150650.1 hypothetical protein [Flavobacterium sp.]
MKTKVKLEIAVIIVFIFSIISCQKKEENKPNIKIEIEKWKKELVVNGEVGKPCQENVDKWSAANPERYYGLPKDSIKTRSFDANNDKINDVLLYFPAGDCCGCSVGVNEVSDFLKLIYSDGSEFLSNDNLRDKIASKIETEFYSQTNTDVERAIFSVTDFNKDISGTYKLWTLEDPDCCASVEGTFKYNPFTFKIEITHQDAK